MKRRIQVTANMLKDANATPIPVVARKGDSFTQDVRHLPENVTPTQTSLKRSVASYGKKGGVGDEGGEIKK